MFYMWNVNKIADVLAVDDSFFYLIVLTKIRSLINFYFCGVNERLVKSL